MLPPIDQFNELTNKQATDALQALFENAPQFADRVAAERPFDSYTELIDRAEGMAGSLPEVDQIEVINGHPQIGASPAAVSSQSYAEQGYDRTTASGNQALADKLASLNTEYERRFGFRFCVFVAGRPRSEIADVMSSRLSAQREEELERALSAVFAIARSRLQKLTQTLEETR